VGTIGPMEITPQAINDVEFRQRVRGYDPDEVDEFLERMAVAVGQLLEQVRDESERALAAERRLAEVDAGAPASVPVADETESISRTLILAQRTADAAIAEAKEQAATVVAQANEQAARTIAEANEAAATTITEAEREARRQIDDTRQRIADEAAELEATRDALRGDVELLERHVDEQRLRLRASIDELHRLLEAPAHFQYVPLPELSGAEVPLFAKDPLYAAEPDLSEPEPAFDDEAAYEPVIEPSVEPAAETLPEPEPEPILEPEAGFAEPVASREPVATDAPLAAAVGKFDDAQEAAWARFAPDAVDLRSADEGPATQSYQFDDELESDDAYLAELRRSMLDETAGVEGSLFDREQEEASSRPRSRFGRKR
jgi:DivIVA domain-containing protein